MVNLKLFFSVPQVTEHAVKFKFTTESLSADHQLYKWLPRARLLETEIEEGDYGVLTCNLHNNQYNDYNLDLWVTGVVVNGNKSEFIEKPKKEKAKPKSTKGSKSTKAKQVESNEFEDDEIPF